MGNQMTDETLGISADGGLTARIRRHYGDLTRLERALADVILECPGEVAAYSATELAALAGVSKMTVSRLVRRLGYAGFEEARLASRGAAESGSPLYLLSKSAPDGKAGAEAGAGGEPPGPEAHFRASIDAIAATARLCRPERIAAVAAALAGARRVWVCGQRNSAFLAGYARWQFIQFRGEVHTLTAAGETWGEALADVGPDDLLFVVAIRRRSPAVVRLLKTAETRALPLALLTDSHTPLEILEPPMTLHCHTRSLTALDNHTAAVAVIHALTAELIRLSGPAGRDRIRLIEALHEDLGEV